MRPLAALLLAGASLCLPLPAGAESPAPVKSSPLAHRGFVTDRASAERAIAFRPFLPDPSPLEVALLPPFHGDQVSANEGIGYAYGREGRTWVLSEWPRNRGTLASFAAFPGANDPHCANAHAAGGSARPRGVVWSTPRGIVLALMPDGGADPRAIVREWHRLIHLGGCR
jgi:hypothetical protein